MVKSLKKGKGGDNGNTKFHISKMRKVGSN